MITKLSAVNDDYPTSKPIGKTSTDSDEDSIDRHNRACEDIDNSNL